MDKNYSQISFVSSITNSINDGCAIQENMREVANFNRRIENNLPFPPTKMYFVGALDSNGRHYRFTKAQDKTD